ncbi:MAG TPA: carbamoyl transferase [Candidatus Atribacteria bacterium]|nr:carbamoyl transferase [Candidatus Atribacteria bacterium]
MDGGDGSSSHVYRVEQGEFEKLCDISSYDSIGNYYSYVTHLCGFKAHKHEGKITGLAAFGEPEYLDLLNGLITYKNGRIFNAGNCYYWSAIKKMKGILPNKFSKKNLACSIQDLLEEIVANYVYYWVDKTEIIDIALAGGVFANVKLNQRLNELKNVDSVFIHPAMGDGGLAVGAAYAVWAEKLLDNGHLPTSYRLDNVYFGQEYSNEEIEDALNKAGLKAKYSNNVEQAVAQFVKDKKVVGWFNGKMEYGPRALGNRSILADPTDASINIWLNKRLKRTEFMPFAPSILDTAASEFYINYEKAKYPAKFMTITFDTTAEAIKKAPPTVHVDNTTRPQVVDKITNPSYYKILQIYEEIKGLPLFINTSFNMHEEPIVCSPEDAIRALKTGAVDVLVMGNWIVKI